MKREDILAKIKAEPQVPVLIIGGGINGLGTFQDLALQGVDVLLVERGDFVSGASAASSHMVHGGIRYLENGEFRLVREAVQERNRMIENAPHYVTPLRTTIPIYKTFSGLLNAPLKFLGWLDRPSERGAVVIKMGLMMYDAYTREQGTVPKHVFRNRQESLKKYEKLNPSVKATATYYDGAMPSPERIAIEVMLDGEDANPNAHAINYMSAVGATGDTVELRDELTGDRFSVKPKIVINAAGPWIDFANQALGQKTKFIGGTKGSHLVLHHPELYEACKGDEFFFENEDGRIVLIFPFQPDRVMVGTTDMKIDNPDEARCTEEEVAYFLEFVGRVFPSIAIHREHVVYQFSGVRPLPASDANTTGQISRDHQNRIIEPGDSLDFPIFNLVGGKWTTYRAFSEKVADDALARLLIPRKTYTRNRAIGGGRDYPQSAADQAQWVQQVAAETGVAAERVQTLFTRYGTGAREIAAYIAMDADAERPLTSNPAYSVREISYIVEREKVVHVLDFLQRRSLLAMTGQVTAPLLRELVELVGNLLGWTREQRQVELTRTKQTLAEEHGVVLKEVQPVETVTAKPGVNGKETMKQQSVNQA